MAVIRLQTVIQAPVERCFDLARSVDLHTVSMARQNEKAVGGRTQGLIELGEKVTWQARHFGITQRLTSKITAFDRPHHFRDTTAATAGRATIAVAFVTHTGKSNEGIVIVETNHSAWVLGDGNRRCSTTR